MQSRRIIVSISAAAIVLVLLVATATVTAHDAYPHLKHHWASFLKGEVSHETPIRAMHHTHSNLLPKAAQEKAIMERLIATHRPRFARKQKVAAQHLSCDSCKSMVSLAEYMTSTAELRNQTIQVLDAVCSSNKSSTPSQVSLCKDIVKIVIDVTPKLWKALDSLAWNIPLTLCADVVKVCNVPCCSGAPNEPEQIFLSFANSSDFVTQMRVTWTTLQATPGAGIRWGPVGSAAVYSAPEQLPTRTYSEGGWVGVIHTAVMTSLAENTAYWYSISGLNENITFRTLPANVGMAGAAPLRIGQIADCAYDNNSDGTIRQLTQLALNGSIHVLVHPGDVGYSDGDTGHFDDWQRKIAPVVKHIPYVVTEGNHESTWWAGKPYRTRLGMSMPLDKGPANATGAYHQLLGPIHMLMFNSETPIDTADISKQQIDDMQGYLDSVVPQKKWLISYHHRPIYCTGGGKLQCEIFSALLRAQITPFYFKNKIDMVITGHIHAYEASYPLDEWGIPVQKDYNNPKGLVSLVSGGAGNREGNSGCCEQTPSWRRTGSNDISFGVHTVIADSYTVDTYRSADMAVLDHFTIVKN